jgi:hypothetical protein
MSSLRSAKDVSSAVDVFGLDESRLMGALAPMSGVVIVRSSSTFDFESSVECG